MKETNKTVAHTTATQTNKTTKNQWKVIGLMFVLALALRIVYYVCSLGYDQQMPRLKETSNYLFGFIIVLSAIILAKEEKRKQ